MTIYRRKPVDLQVIQWTGDNEEEVQNFLRDGHSHSADGWVKGQYVEIGTKFGLRLARVGDYIIREPGLEHGASNFYPCTKESLAAGYFEVCL